MAAEKYCDFQDRYSVSACQGLTLSLVKLSAAPTLYFGDPDGPIEDLSFNVHWTTEHSKWIENVGAS